MLHRLHVALITAVIPPGLKLLRVRTESFPVSGNDICDAVLQVGFGSGFKCNSAVWKAMRNIHDTEHVEWMHMKNGNLERCWNYVQVHLSASVLTVRA